jgi:branched-chain amino acid transport system ATP-binding protein
VTSTPVLEIRDVDAGYGDTPILHEVSISVPAGGVVALLGPNGAGKTTLLRAASGLIKATSGSIWFAGEDATAAKPYQLARRGLCHIPESRGVYPSLTVRENLVLHTRRADEKQVIAEAVEHFPIIGQRLGQRAGEMSGGEQQMLAVVRSYLAGPKLVLVDEVSMGLAPVVVDRIYEFLKTIVKGGTSLLLVEQYVGRALAVASSVVVMAKGRVAFQGPPSELKDDVFAHYMGATVARAGEG